MQAVVFLCAQITSLRNSPDLAFYTIPKSRRIQREYVRLPRNANLKLNSDSTRIFIFHSSGFSRSKIPPGRHIFLQLHIFMFLSFNSTFRFAILSCQCFNPAETFHFAFRHVCSYYEVAHRFGSIGHLLRGHVTNASFKQ